MSRSKQVSFSASEELYDALEIYAYADRKTIADTLRRIVARELAEYNLLDARAPLTEQTGSSNGRFVPKAARANLHPADARP